MDYEKIGKFIASRRKELNMTQQQLADKLHVTNKAISKWENGLGCPDVSILGELSESLEVGIGEILNGEFDQNLKDNNQFIMDAVAYSKKNTTQKIYLKISYILSLIMLVLCTYMLGIGIYQFYKLSEKDIYIVKQEKVEEMRQLRDNLLVKLDKLKGYPQYEEKWHKSVIYLISKDLNYLNDYFEEENLELNYVDYRAQEWRIKSLLAFTMNYLQEFTKDNKQLQDIKMMGEYFSSAITLWKDNGDWISSTDWTYDMSTYKYENIYKKKDIDGLYNILGSYLTNTNKILDRILEVGNE